MLKKSSACENYLTAMSKVGARVGDFYLLLGQQFTIADQTKDYEAYRGPMGSCYKNAFDLAQERQELAYCEGYALSAGLFPMHHAWCVTAEGVVVDPTWDASTSDYYGVPLNTGFVLNQILRTKVWGVFGEHVPKEALGLDLNEFIHPAWQPELTKAKKWHQLIKHL